MGWSNNSDCAIGLIKKKFEMQKVFHERSKRIEIKIFELNSVAIFP